MTPTISVISAFAPTAKVQRLVPQDVDVADGRRPALHGVDQLLVNADQRLLELEQGLLGLLREAREESGLLSGLGLELVQGHLLLRCERADVLSELGELNGLVIPCDDERGDPVRAQVELGIVRGKEDSGLFNWRGTAFVETPELRRLHANVDGDPALDLRDLLAGEGRHRCGM